MNRNGKKNWFDESWQKKIVRKKSAEKNWKFRFFSFFVKAFLTENWKHLNNESNKIIFRKRTKENRRCKKSSDLRCFIDNFSLVERRISNWFVRCVPSNILFRRFSAILVRNQLRRSRRLFYSLNQFLLNSIRTCSYRRPLKIREKNGLNIFNFRISSIDLQRAEQRLCSDEFPSVERSICLSKNKKIIEKILLEERIQFYRRNVRTTSLSSCFHRSCLDFDRRAERKEFENIFARRFFRCSCFSRCSNSISRQHFVWSSLDSSLKQNFFFQLFLAAEFSRPKRNFFMHPIRMFYLSNQSECILWYID